MLDSAPADGHGDMGIVQDGLGGRFDAARFRRCRLETFHSDHVLDVYILAKGNVRFVSLCLQYLAVSYVYPQETKYGRTTRGRMARGSISRVSCIFLVTL